MNIGNGTVGQALLVGGAAALSYLVGAIPFGLIVARARGVDIRRVGSGNIGATNVFRCVGRTWGLLTFALDFLKGFVPAFILPAAARRWVPGVSVEFLSLLCGCAAVIGHTWPVYLGFRGGKGMATGAGALLGIAPLVMLAGMASWVAIFLVTRYVSVASILSALAIVVSSWMLADGHVAVPAALTFMGAVVIWRHRSNIARLRAGTEHRFEFGRERQKN